MSVNNFLANARRELLEPAKSNMPALDGMRGFASLIVVFYHCAIFLGFYNFGSKGEETDSWIVHLTNGFWTGIDIFFVLSGFLIGGMLIRDLDNSGNLHFKAFFLRRSFRIFPAYFFILTLSLFVIAPLDIPAFNFLYMTGDWNELLESAWSNYLYVVNYVRPGNEPSILSWGWSLAVEEHFYLILPPTLWILFRSTKSSYFHIFGLFAFILIPFLGRAVQYILDPSIQLMQGFYYYSHNRFDEIFVGVLIGYFYVMHKDALRELCEKLGGWILGGLGLMGVALVWFHGGLHKDGMFVVVFQFNIMALAVGLIMLNCLFLTNPLTFFFSYKKWYLLARISYGTYLIHPFVIFGLIQLYRDFIDGAAFTGFLLIPFYLAVMLISSVLAALMFVTIESPMLKLGVKLSRKYRLENEAHYT